MKAASDAYIGWITSQNDTAPKPPVDNADSINSWITSQNDTAPKPVRLARGQVPVGLPVRTTLRQNTVVVMTSATWLDYQSERHCAKTREPMCASVSKLDYQSERHCAKTEDVLEYIGDGLDYQSERHCAKTQDPENKPTEGLDYQSERHCAKTPLTSA